MAAPSPSTDELDRAFERIALPWRLPVLIFIVVPLGVAVALLGLLLPPLLTLGVLTAAVVGLLFSLRLDRAIRSEARATPSAGLAYLCVCFVLVSATGVEVVPGLAVGQVAAFATLLVFLMRRTETRCPPTGRAFALTAALLLLVGSSIAAFWNGTSESIGFVGEFVLVVVPILLAMRRFGPTREEAMTLMKAWLVGVLLSVMAGLSFAKIPAGRSAGFTAHPNQFGMQTAMAIPVVWGLYENGRLSRRQALLAIVVLWAAVLASGARSGLIAAAIATLFVTLRALGAVATIVATVLFGALGWFVITGAGAGLAEFGALGRLLGKSSTSASDTGRVELMSDGLARVNSLDTRLLGAGWIHYRQPHNILILGWVSAGLMGVLAVAILIGVSLARSANLRADTFEWCLAVSAITFLTALLLNNALTAPFGWAVFALMEFRWSQPVRRGRTGRPSYPPPQPALTE